MRAKRHFHKAPLPICAALVQAMLLAFVLALTSGLAAPAFAQDWKQVRIRDLSFEVPADWQFVYDVKETLGVYLPDARHTNDKPFGISVWPNHLGDQLAPSAIEKKKQEMLAGVSVTELVMRPDRGTRGRVFDFEVADSDGKPLAVILTGPEAGWDSWNATFNHILSSMRIVPDPTPLAVPDLNGTWYFNGKASPEARAIDAQAGAYFIVNPDVGSGGDARIEVVRLGPLQLRIASGATETDGTIDATGSRIEWNDGTFWTRTPLADAAPPTPSPQPVAETEAPQQPAPETLVAAIDNKGAVQNGPTKPLVIDTPDPIRILSIRTYHWNNGRGKAPGTISLRGSDGRIYGPWQAVGQPGQGNLDNAYWYVEPNALLEPGSYELLDSDPATWATNAEANSRGFVVIKYQKLQAVAVEATPHPTPTVPAIPAAETSYQPFVAGPLSTRVPDSWVLSATEGDPISSYYAVDPRGEGVAGIALVRLQESSAAQGFAAYVAQANATLLQGGQEIARTEPQAPFTLSAHYDGVMAWGSGNSRPTRFDAVGVPIDTGVAILFVAYPSDVRPRAAEQVSRILAEAEVEGSAPPQAVLDALSALASGTQTTAEQTPIEKSAAPLDWRSPENEVLFDGTDSDRFVHIADNLEFDRFARFENGALVVDVPENGGSGRVGLQGPAPLVWLDGFVGDAEVTVTFTIDPAQSTGFVLALGEPKWGGFSSNNLHNNAFEWHRTPDGQGRAEFRLDLDAQWSMTGDQSAPSTVSFILRPGEITLAAEGYEPVTKHCPFAVDGAGLRLWFYAQSAEANAPVGFALDQIAVTRSNASATTVSGPAPGVEPLPMETVFDGAMNGTWQQLQLAGGDFAGFARFADGALVVDAPENHSWAKVGLLSADPLVTLDHRVETQPMRLAVTLDPNKPEDLVVALAGNKMEEMWFDHVVWFSLVYLPEEDRWVMGVHHDEWNDWYRDIDPAWMTAHWDGRLWLDVGPGWAEMRIPDGPAVRGTVPTLVNAAYYATVFGQAPVENDAAHLTLKRIERGIATPDGMTALDRWLYVDDDAFDADRFMNDLAAQLPTVVENYQKQWIIDQMGILP